MIYVYNTCNSIIISIVTSFLCYIIIENWTTAPTVKFPKPDKIIA